MSDRRERMSNQKMCFFVFMVNFQGQNSTIHELFFMQEFFDFHNPSMKTQQLKLQCLAKNWNFCEEIKYLKRSVTFLFKINPFGHCS